MTILSRKKENRTRAVASMNGNVILRKSIFFSADQHANKREEKEISKTKLHSKQSENVGPKATVE
jgi:hypothetical protein